MGNLPTRTQKMMGERIAEVNPSGERGSLPQLSFLLPFPWSRSLVSSLALLKGHKLTLKRELLSLSFFSLSLQMPLSQPPLLRGCFTDPQRHLALAFAVYLIVAHPSPSFSCSPSGPGLRSWLLSPSPLTPIPFLEVSGLVEALASPPFWSSLRCL